MSSILAVRYRPVAREILDQLLASIEMFVSNAEAMVAKQQIVAAAPRVAPEFLSVECSGLLVMLPGDALN